MDWTIVTSVLIALLLWVLSLFLLAAGVFAVAFTILRGRSERMAVRLMETCGEHFRAMMEGGEARKTGAVPANGLSFNPEMGTGPCEGAVAGREARHVAHR